MTAALFLNLYTGGRMQSCDQWNATQQTARATISYNRLLRIWVSWLFHAQNPVEYIKGLKCQCPKQPKCMHSQQFESFWTSTCFGGLWCPEEPHASFALLSSVCGGTQSENPESLTAQWRVGKREVGVFRNI